jgi:hypothetical protein
MRLGETGQRILAAVAGLVMVAIVLWLFFARGFLLGFLVVIIGLSGAVRLGFSGLYVGELPAAGRLWKPMTGWRARLFGSAVLLLAVVAIAGIVVLAVSNHEELLGF